MKVGGLGPCSPPSSTTYAHCTLLVRYCHVTDGLLI